MNIGQLHEHCMAVKSAAISTAFFYRNQGVYVVGKMIEFASLVLEDGVFVVNLKWDTDRPVELCEGRCARRAYLELIAY